ALAQGLRLHLRPGNLPRHSSKRCGEVVLRLGGTGQLDPQRAWRLRRPQLLEDLQPQHFLGDTDANLRKANLLPLLFNVEAQIVAQVEQTLLLADRDAPEIRLLIGELHAGLIAEAELGSAARVVRRDQEVEVLRHWGQISLFRGLVLVLATRGATP